MKADVTFSARIRQQCAAAAGVGAFRIVARAVATGGHLGGNACPPVFGLRPADAVNARFGSRHEHLSDGARVRLSPRSLLHHCQDVRDEYQGGAAGNAFLLVRAVAETGRDDDQESAADSRSYEGAIEFL